QLMPFAPKIRKKLIHSLEEHILPMLKTRLISQVLAAPPFDFGGFETKILDHQYLPDNANNPFEIRRDWPEHHLLATRGLRLEFRQSGSSHRKVGIREGHAAQVSQSGAPLPPATQMLAGVAPASLLSADVCPREAAEFYEELAHDCDESVMVFFD